MLNTVLLQKSCMKDGITVQQHRLGHQLARKHLCRKRAGNSSIQEGLKVNMGKLRPLIAQVATKSPSCGNTSVASKSREVILPLHLAPGSCCSVVPNCGLPSIRNTWLSCCESSGGSSKCLRDCSLLHMRTDFLLFPKISVTPTFYQETSSPPLQFP